MRSITAHRARLAGGALRPQRLPSAHTGKVLVHRGRPKQSSPQHWDRCAGLPPSQRPSCAGSALLQGLGRAAQERPQRRSSPRSPAKAEPAPTAGPRPCSQPSFNPRAHRWPRAASILRPPLAHFSYGRLPQSRPAPQAAAGCRRRVRGPAQACSGSAGLKLTAAGVFEGQRRRVPARRASAGAPCAAAAA